MALGQGLTVLASPSFAPWSSVSFAPFGDLTCESSGWTGIVADAHLLRFNVEARMDTFPRGDLRSPALPEATAEHDIL